MRVLIGAFGTRGDVQPMLALTQALRARGHEVTAVVPPEAVADAAKYGTRVVPAGLSYVDVSRRLAAGRLRDVLAVLPDIRRQVREHFDVLRPLLADADLLVGASVFALGSAFSRRFHRPYAYFALAPTMVDSDELPGPLAPWPTLPRWVNGVAWWVTRRLWDAAVGGLLTGVRRELGLDAGADVWTQVLGRHTFLATAPALAPGPVHWRQTLAQPGPLFLDTDDALSAATADFLAGGEPPVYLGFGSMQDPDPVATTRRVLEAVQRAGVRAVLSRGWAQLGGVAVPDTVHVCGAEPHHLLFPRCLGVVHHGGAGTTHSAARAGVPQLVLPQILDQFYWRHRLLELGLMPFEVPRYGRDPVQLAAALSAFKNPALRERARRFADQVPLDGAARAAEALERLAREYQPAS